MSELKVKLTYYQKKTYCGKNNKLFDYTYSAEMELVRLCCRDFKEACSEGYIGLNKEEYRITHFGPHIKVGISYPEDSWEDYMAITYCPFCGEKIEVVIEEIHDKITKSLQFYKNSKTTFLKGLNKVLLHVKIHGINARRKEGKFLYKYGMDKIVWRDKK